MKIDRKLPQRTETVQRRKGKEKMTNTLLE